MDSITDVQRYALTGVLVLLFIGVLCWVFHLLGGQRRFTAWRDQRRLTSHVNYISDLLHEYSDTALHFAMLEREIAERIGTAPAEFIPPLIKAVKAGHAAQRALFARASEFGIYAPELMEPEEPAQQEPTPSPPPESAPEPKKPIALRVVGASSLTWDENGHLVPHK